MDDPTPLRLYTAVAMVTDAYAAQGVRIGMVGYVIERLADDAYEVEFSDPATGVTIAQLVIGAADAVAEPAPGGVS